MRAEAREQAYVEFVAARQTHLRRIAYAVWGDWDRADALLHDALTRLYVAWPRVERDGTEEEFVRRVVLRAKPGGGDRARRSPDDPDEPGTPDEPEETSALFAALQELPLAQRKTVVLRHWLGLSVEQTAEDLGVSRGTVEGLEARALASLRTAPAAEGR